MNTPIVASSRSEAKAAGGLHYFTGNPCSHGHVAVRWTRNGECTACAAAKRSEPHRRKKYNEKAKETYAECRVEVSERQKAARQRDPDSFRRRQERYCQKNPEKRRQSAREYYAKNRGKYLVNARSRALCVKRATPKWADIKAIEAVYRRAKQLEGETGTEYHVDHQVPLKGVNSRGEHIVCGLNVHYNLVPIPAWENRAKSNKFEVI